MATGTKFQKFVEDVGDAVHSFKAAAHTLRCYLSNTAPNAATHAVKADLAEIATGFGYAGPVDTQNDASRSGGTLSVTGVDFTVTAAGGSIGPFRYVVLYNDTPVSPADPLIQSWDYGSAVTLADGESFTVDFGTSMFTFA